MELADAKERNAASAGTAADGPESETGSAGRPIWRNRQFMLVLAGNIVSVFGDCFNGIALSLWILQTTGSAKQMAAVLITHMTVTILFGSLAGTVADRLDRRRLMLTADLFRAAVMCVLAYTLFVGNAPFAVMIGLVALSAGASLLQSPAFHASIVQLVGRERLQQATGVIHLADNVARISGLALAGVAVAAFGGFGALMINAGAYLLCAMCVLAAGGFPSVRNDAGKQQTSLLADLRGGFAYIRQDRLTRSIVLLNPILILFFMSSFMLIQVMAVTEWKADPVTFGLIETCIPLGYMAGAGIILAFGSRLGRRGWWICGGMILLGPSFWALSLVPSAWFGMPIILLNGLLFAFCSMLIQIILRSEIRADMQGRIYGTLGAITSIAPALGLAVSSAMADRWGVREVLGAQGAALLVVSLIVASIMKPIRQYQ
ncbi:MFS transporter [Paenibacillaceae bacterium WGS1546]|uniref:MFS transporter n=1 Tax=Cohnella sp. WGS1546 TaxID=3366810 RepID=UPI00372CE999